MALGLSRHHAAAMAKPPVKVPRVGVVQYRGRLWYAQRTARGLRLLQPVPGPQRRRAVRRRPMGIGRSGAELASVAGKLPLVGSVIAALAPVLDTSLQNVQCAPGNPNWPACATPGGSAAALTQSIGTADLGLKPEIAAQIVKEAVAGMGGGGTSTQNLGLERPTLREQ